MARTRFIPGRAADRAQAQANDRFANALDRVDTSRKFALETAPTLNVAAGELRRLAPRADGQEVVVPEAAAANFGQSITLFVQGSAGSVRIRPSAGTINGAAAVEVPAAGISLLVLVSDGAGGWACEGHRVDDDVIIRTIGAAQLIAGTIVRLSTGGTERLEIRANGAFQVNGSDGSAGDVLTSAGGAAPPNWAAPASQAGRLLSRTVYTTGTGATHNHAAACNTFIVRMQAGGGGGTGVPNSTAGQASCGTPGSAGNYAERTFTKAAASSTYTVGALGAAGDNTGAAAGAGGDTTWTHNAVTATATGGPGATATIASGTAIALGNPALTPAASTNCDVATRGQSGLQSLRLSATIIQAGKAGSSPWGDGGRSRATQGAGQAGTGPGCGGSGGVSINAGGAVTGGAGTAGFI